MAAEISRVCGPREADGYLRFVDYARRLWQLERADFIERNLDAPTDLLTAQPAPAARRRAAFRRLQTKIDQFFRDPRTRRIFSFQAMYAGLAPHDALALYAVIAYLDSVAGVYFPRGGIHAVPRALAGAAEKHGVADPVRHHGDPGRDRGRPRHRRAHRRRRARPGRRRGAQPRPAGRLPRPAARAAPAAQAALLAVLRRAARRVVGRRYARIAHHNIHFGRSWKGTFDEVIRPRRADDRPVAAGHQPQPHRPGAWRRPAGTPTTCSRPCPTWTRRRSTGAATSPTTTRTALRGRWRSAATSGSPTASRSAG